MKNVYTFTETLLKNTVPTTLSGRVNFALEILGQCPSFVFGLDKSIKGKDNFPHLTVTFDANQCIEMGLEEDSNFDKKPYDKISHDYSVRTGRSYHSYYQQYFYELMIKPKCEAYKIRGGVVIQKLPFHYVISVFDNKLIQIEVWCTFDNYSKICYLIGADFPKDQNYTSIEDMISKLLTNEIKKIKTDIKKRIECCEKEIQALKEYL